MSSDPHPAVSPASPQNPPDEAAPLAGAEPPRSQPPSPHENIFFKDSELRPIWRMFLYAAMASVLYFLVGIVASYLREHIDSPIRVGLLVEIGLLIVAIAPSVVLSRMERRPWGDYGLPRAGILGKLFWTGLAWGLAAITLLMLGLRASGAYDIERMSLHGGRILKFAVFWGAFFLIVAVFEEFLMRGYTQFTMAKAIGFWPSALLLSSGFAAIHLNNPGETAPGIVATGVIGLFFCLTLRRTGNLWFAVGFHASWDWGESFLYSVPNSGGTAPGHLLRAHLHGPVWLSGGTAGPEGSMLLFILVALLWVAFALTHKLKVAEQAKP